MTDVRVLTMTEYEPLVLDKHELDELHADLLYQQANGKISIEAPGPATGHKWKLTSNGYVGYWPIADDLALSLQPRVPLGNIFRMLEYAYDLSSFQMFDGISQCSSLREFYERLANVLAKRVLDRGRRGFHRTYVAWEERLGHVRGRVDILRSLRRPWEPTVPCHFEEHTADIDDNAILAQTLLVIARSGMCSGQTARTVRRAYRAIAGLAPARGATAADCLGRLYDRLNQDYQPMHALCRFFLEHSGPTQDAGDRDMIPFLVHMPALFERFVAVWLGRNLPPGLELRPQYSMSFGDSGELKIQIDLLLRDAEGRAVCVLDTKYKISGTPKLSDCEQVVAYAVANRCTEAVLVYPFTHLAPIDVPWGSVRLQTTSFVLDGDLQANGESMIAALGFDARTTNSMATATGPEQDNSV